LGQPERVWRLLKQQPDHDPRVRSYLIDRLGALAVDPQLVITQLDREPDASARRALILTLGEFKPESLPTEKLRARLLELYRNDPDAGIHGAAEWLLRQWNDKDALAAVKDLETGKAQGQRRWYVNGQGQTLSIISGPVKFSMGSPLSEEGRQTSDYSRHERRLNWSFAVGTTEVTVEQYLQFGKEHEFDRQSAPTNDCPVNKVTWYDAAAYCNWLSEQEGIPPEQWCYEPHPQRQFAEGMHVKVDYLKLSGYRLPSEAEWEYACRAETTTSRHYGETDELLGKYACYVKNSPHGSMLPVTRLRPNDLGLFGTIGNVMEWTQDAEDSARRSAEDRQRPENVIDAKLRIVRGGSFSSNPGIVRAAYRTGDGPVNRRNSTGFRVARTLPQ